MHRLKLLGAIFLVSGLASCAAPPAIQPAQPTQTTVSITGSPGAAIHGFYVADGNRSEFSAALPATLHIHGITVLAYAKQSAADKVDAEVRESNGGYMTCDLRANDDQAAFLKLGSAGMSLSYVPITALTAPVTGGQIVIKPYWYQDTWVFDDPATGLSKEAFVRGVPDMMNTVVKDIPDARSGFRLTASEKPFDGYQKKLTWVRAESGGNFYRLDGAAMEGWLCPELFRYFDHAPKALYIRADAMTAEK